MNKKKLNVTNMMGSDAALSRSEMKKIMAGSGSGSCTCMYNGCMVTVNQGPYSYGISVTCDDGYEASSGGGGTWNGTACGGQC